MSRRFFHRLAILPAASFLLACWSLPAAAADEVELRMATEVNELRRVGISLEVGGHLLVNVEGKEQKLPMRVSALFRHQERILSTMDGKPGEDSKSISHAARSVRIYDEIKADLEVDGRSIKPQLREDRRLIGVNVDGEKATFVSLHGPLTREELDLVQTPGDSMIVSRLLPADGKAREVDATWKHDADTMAILLGLEAVGSTDVESKLYELTDSLAKIEMNGTVHGAVDGIATQIELRGRYYFQRKSQRINGLELHWKEKRAVGHTAPGVDVTARLKMHVAQLKEVPALGDEALTGTELEPGAEAELLEHTAQGNNIRFYHDSRWHVTQDSDRRVIMRLVDDGELVAQCNLVERKPMKAGNRQTLKEFQQDIQRALGDKFGNFTRARESMNEAENVVYQVEAEGRVSDLPIKWIYYLVSAKDGRRVSVVFTMEGPLVEQFGESQEPIVSSLMLLEPEADTDAAESESTVSTEAEGGGVLNPQSAKKQSKRADRAAQKEPAGKSVLR